MLYTTALSYHAELGVMNFVSAKAMGVAAITLPSETIFSFELKRNFAFGIPISVSSGGLAMDADRLYSLVKSLDGNTEKPKQFFLTSGMNGSALEHSVPEQLFSTPENPAQGISAVKALQIANEQGIPIYTINQTNINTTLPQLQVDGDVKTDIQNAVNAGKIVTVSKTNINFNGWVGCGYTIIDPNTGAGAYMISGGTNGAFVYALWFIGLVILIVVAAVCGGFLVAGLAWAIATVIPVITAALSALAGYIADIYLAISVMISESPWLMALYTDLMLWAQLAPSSPLPTPSTPAQWVAFFWMLRNLIIINLKKTLSMKIDHFLGNSVIADLVDWEVLAYQRSKSIVKVLIPQVGIDFYDAQTDLV